MTDLSDRLAKRTLPRLVAEASTVRGPAKTGAALRRAAGRRGRVELFFAFDDPASALALVELDRRLAGRSVDLVAIPVTDHGMKGDPAVEAKRIHAVADTARLARRHGLELSRREVIEPDQVMAAMEWAAAAGPASAVTGFSVELARGIWFEGSGPLDIDRVRRIWQERVGTAPRAAEGPGALAANARRMRKRGAYAVPMAWVHGRLYFAHERLDQICDELDSLGWVSSQ